MSNLFKLPTWADKDHIYAVVETPRGSKVKLEFDAKLHVFTLAKPLFTGLSPKAHQSRTWPGGRAKPKRPGRSSPA
jgi:inorganic pyrophosphatase